MSGIFDKWKTRLLPKRSFKPKLWSGQQLLINHMRQISKICSPINYKDYKDFLSLRV